MPFEELAHRIVTCATFPQVMEVMSAYSNTLDPRQIEPVDDRDVNVNGTDEKEPTTAVCNMLQRDYERSLDDFNLNRWDYQIGILGMSRGVPIISHCKAKHIKYLCRLLRNKTRDIENLRLRPGRNQRRIVVLDRNIHRLRQRLDHLRDYHNVRDEHLQLLGVLPGFPEQQVPQPLAHHLLPAQAAQAPTAPAQAPPQAPPQAPTAQAVPLVQAAQAAQAEPDLPDMGRVKFEDHNSFNDV